MLTVTLKKTGTANGFTLIELMVVIAIIAILTMVVLPTYQDHVRKAKRSIGRAELMAVLARQEQFFVMNKQYAARLDLLGYTASPYAIGADGEEVPVTSPTRIYLIGIIDALPDTAPQRFSLRATPQLAQAGDTQCGALQITSLGIKTAGESAANECW